jgi:hypothetical protein
MSCYGDGVGVSVGVGCGVSARAGLGVGVLVGASGAKPNLKGVSSDTTSCSAVVKGRLCIEAVLVWTNL